jgi:hypothetical protein
MKGPWRIFKQGTVYVMTNIVEVVGGIGSGEAPLNGPPTPHQLEVIGKYNDYVVRDADDENGS